MIVKPLSSSVTTTAIKQKYKCSIKILSIVLKSIFSKIIRHLGNSGLWLPGRRKRYERIHFQGSKNNAQDQLLSN